MRTFRNRYAPYKRTGQIACGDLTRTKQADAAACDINNIMKKYEKTGVLPDLIKKNPRYGDFSDVPTYQDSLHLVHFSQEQFASLSAKVRRRFHNDPVEFLAFTQDASNAEEMAKLGLMSKDAVERVQAAKTAPPQAAPLAAEGSPKASSPKAKKGSDTES